MKKLVLLSVVVLLSVNVLGCEPIHKVFVSCGVTNTTEIPPINKNYNYFGVVVGIDYETPMSFYNVGIHSNYSFCNYTNEINTYTWNIGLNMGVNPFYSVDKYSPIHFKVIGEIGYNGTNNSFYHSYGCRLEFGRYETKLFIQDRFVIINDCPNYNNVVELGMSVYFYK